MSNIKISQLPASLAVDVLDNFVIVHSGTTLKTTGQILFDDIVTNKDLANKSYVDNAITLLTGAAPVLLNTLKELATAIGDDPNFAVTILAQLDTKVNNADFNSKFDTNLAAKTTANLAEGSHLYYTDARVRNAISTSGTELSYDSTSGVVTFTMPTTSGIAEGGNLYYTDTRARSAINVVSSNLSYDVATGNISIIADPIFNSVTINGAVVNPTDAATKAYVDSHTASIVGGIALTTDNIAEGETNLYYTDARVANAAFDGGEF